MSIEEMNPVRVVIAPRQYFELIRTKNLRLSELCPTLIMSRIIKRLLVIFFITI